MFRIALPRTSARRSGGNPVKRSKICAATGGACVDAPRQCGCSAAEGARGAAAMQKAIRSEWGDAGVAVKDADGRVKLHELFQRVAKGRHVPDLLGLAGRHRAEDFARSRAFSMPGLGLGGGYACTERRKTGGAFAHSPVIGRDRPAAGGRWLRTCGPPTRRSHKRDNRRFAGPAIHQG